MSDLPIRRPYGAVPVGDGSVEFRVWAPNARRVAVRLDDGDHDLAHVWDGVYERRVPAIPGDDYRYVEWLRGVARGTAVLTAADERVGEFARLGQGSSQLYVTHPRFYPSTDGVLYVAPGTLSSDDLSFYASAPIDSAWVRLETVGGRIALTADSVLFDGYYTNTFQVRGITAGVDTIVATIAVVSTGYTAQKMQLDDGSVWVANGDPDLGSLVERAANPLLQGRDVADFVDHVGAVGSGRDLDALAAGGGIGDRAFSPFVRGAHEGAGPFFFLEGEFLGRNRGG